MIQNNLPHILIDQSKDIIWMINCDFHLVYANRSYLQLMKEITGVEKKLNESVFVDGFGKDHTNKWKAYYTRAIKGEYFEIEEHYYHPEKNETLYSQITFEPLTDNNNKIFAVACQSRDITRIVKQKTEEHQLLDASLDVFCTVNDQGNFVYVSAASEKHWGYKPEELVGTNFRDLILEDDLSKSDLIIAASFTGVEIKSFVNRYMKKDGGIAYNLWSARWDANTKLRYAVAKDCKEKIEQEEKMLQSEQRFKALVQEGSDLIRILDAEGNFMYISPSSTSIIGNVPEEFVGRNALEFIHPEDVEKVKASFQKIITENRVIVETYRFQNHKKEWRWFEAVFTNMLNNPAVNGIVVNSRDITEEKKLRELNQQVGNIAKIGSWEVDYVNQTLYWSDMVHLMHETDSKLFVPTLESAINFYREDFRQMVQSEIEKCISTKEPFDFEAVLVTAKKKELWVRATGNAEYEDGVCKSLYGSFQDINDSKSSENRLLSLSENLPGVIYQYTIHTDGTDSISHISGAVEQLWGYTKEEVLLSIKPLWEEIRLGGEIELVRSSILKSVQTKSKWTCRYRIVVPNGEVRTHLGNGTPSFLADGSVVFNVMILDITQEAKNEELLNQASEMARIGSWELDLINQDGDSMYWSPMIKEILELDDDYKPTLTSGLAFYNGENKEKVQDAVTNLISEGIEFDKEILLLTGKRNQRWIRIIGKSETANNKRTKIYGSFQDIDERKKAEIKLAESEHRLRTILEVEPECVKLLGPSGELLKMNPAGLAMIEADNEEQVLGKSLNEIVLSQYCTAFAKLTQDVFKGESGKLIFEINGLKGTHRWMETHAVPMKNEQGDIVSLLAVTRDITERKKAEESLLLANERFEKVTEATNDAIWDWDIVNQTIYRSKAYERFFGKEVSKSFDIEDFWNKHFHPEELLKNRNSIYEAIENPFRSRWELEYKIFNQLGETLYIIDRGLIIRNNEGKAIRMVGAMTDITEQKLMNVQLSELNKKLQQHTIELERSNEELEQFAFVASHDLQEPLRMISSFMDLLKLRYGDLLDEKAHKYIYFATDGAKRMKSIILDLLEYSKANKSADNKVEVDLNNVISEFKLLRRKLISEKDALIKHNNLPTLITYKAAITQVFHCLVDNALKYSFESTVPIIEINANENEIEWEFSIKDNGIGIEAEFFNKIFVIFQRLHNMNEYYGTGIGLSITKRHVEFLGGRIWLESTVGEGSIFYFTIPKNK